MPLSLSVHIRRAKPNVEVKLNAWDTFPVQRIPCIQFRIIVWSFVHNTMKITARPTLPWKKPKHIVDCEMKRNETKWWRVCRLALQCKWEYKKLHCTDENVIQCTCLSQFLFCCCIQSLVRVCLCVMRWSCACLSFKWKWPSKMAFMSCTLSVVHIMCMHFTAGTHCYYRHTHTVLSTQDKRLERDCEKNTPNPRQFMRVCTSEVLLFRSFLLKIVHVFVVAGSIQVKEAKNCLRNYKRKTNVNACLYRIKTHYFHWSFSQFAHRWCACNWIHLSYNHLSAYLWMRRRE